MSVLLERTVILTDETDGTELTVKWDPDNDPARFIVEADDGIGNATKLYVTHVDLLAFADLILKTYAEHDPF